MVAILGVVTLNTGNFNNKPKVDEIKNQFAEFSFSGTGSLINKKPVDIFN